MHCRGIVHVDVNVEKLFLTKYGKTHWLRTFQVLLTGFRAAPAISPDIECCLVCVIVEAADNGPKHKECWAVAA